MRRSILKHQELEDQMRSANSELITAMSHDLRTPLTALLAYLEIIERKKYADEAQLDQLVHKSINQTLQIKNVSKINDLVTLFGSNIKGDLTVENLLWFAKEAVFGGLNVDAVEFVTMPWKGANPYIYPDQEKLLELINTKLNPFNTEITVNELDLIYVDADGNLHATSDSKR